MQSVLLQYETRQSSWWSIGGRWHLSRIGAVKGYNSTTIFWSISVLLPAQCICSALSGALLWVYQQFSCPLVNSEVGIVLVSTISHAVLSGHVKHTVCAVCAVQTTSALNSVPVSISTDLLCGFGVTVVLSMSVTVVRHLAVGEQCLCHFHGSPVATAARMQCSKAKAIAW